MTQTTLERTQAAYGPSFAGNVAEDFMMVEHLAQAGESIARIEMMMRFRYSPDTIRIHLNERGIAAPKRSVPRTQPAKV